MSWARCVLCPARVPVRLRQLRCRARPQPRDDTRLRPRPLYPAARLTAPLGLRLRPPHERTLAPPAARARFAHAARPRPPRARLRTGRIVFIVYGVYMLCVLFKRGEPAARSRTRATGRGSCRVQASELLEDPQAKVRKARHRSDEALRCCRAGIECRHRRGALRPLMKFIGERPWQQCGSPLNKAAVYVVDFWTSCWTRDHDARSRPRRRSPTLHACVRAHANASVDLMRSLCNSSAPLRSIARVHACLLSCSAPLPAPAPAARVRPPRARGHAPAICNNPGVAEQAEIRPAP